MKLLIAGSRTYANQLITVCKLLDSITGYTYSQTLNQDDICPLPNLCHNLGLMFEDISEVISGCASGIDHAGMVWAEQHKIPVMKMPADWKKYGVTAGFKCNEEMAKLCDCAIIIWDKKSRGTQHMMDMLHKYDKEYLLWDKLPVVRRKGPNVVLVGM